MKELKRNMRANLFLALRKKVNMEIPTSRDYEAFLKNSQMNLKEIKEFPFLFMGLI